MADPKVEARVLTGLLEAVRAKANREPPSIWVPQRHLKTETPLDIVRGIAAKHPWPAEWETTLRMISEQSDTFSWLYGAWLNIAQRWVLYEMLPYAMIPESKRVQLGGTPYWEMPKHLRAGREQAVSAFQWDMYRTLKVWARPFWVIQGNDGGTPAQYSELEQAILQAQGEDTEPPEAGSLPYAPFDGRTERQLRQRDRLWKLHQRLDRLRASGDNEVLKAETEAADRAFREQFWSWWKERVQPQAEFWTWFSAREEAQHLTRQTTDAEARAVESAEETYLTTGQLPVTIHD